MPTKNAKVAIELFVDDKGSLKVREFSQDSKKSFGEIEKSGTGSAGKVKGAWSKVTGVWGKVAAAVTAVVAATVALIITSAKQAKELEILARLANTTTSEFQKYAFATEQVGVSGEKFAEMSKDLQDKLGDFIATGGGEFADFFENVGNKIGLTAEKLAELSGPDALIAVKKAMDDANVSAEQQVFYLESIANDASLLTPLLENNGAAFKEQAKHAEELGIGLSKIDHKNLLAAGKATKEMTSAFGGLKNKLASVLAPVLTAVMGVATKLIIGLRDEAVALTKTFANVGMSLKGWGAVFDGRLGFLEFAKMDAKELEEWLKKDTAAMGEFNQQLEAQVGKGLADYKKKIEASTEALRKQGKVKQSILDKHKKATQEQEATEAEMYKEAGIGAEQYFSNEAQELVEKAAKWKKAGGDVIKVEEWLYDQLGELSTDAWEKGETAAGLSMDSLQAMTGHLTEQFDQANANIINQLDAVGIKVAEMEGQEIGITASLDGSAVISGIDGLMAKFAELQAASASASAARTVSSSSVSSSSSYENTDPTLSASEVAAASNVNNTVNVNINQQMSRADVNNVVTSETSRVEARS